MQAIILAAGVGKRLTSARRIPKCLLEFAGRTLLARHLETLAALGVRQVTLVVGFEAGRIAAALDGVHVPRVLIHYNPLFTLGSVVSLWSARHTLAAADDVLLMDADVLYDPAILARLVASPHRNCFLIDRDFTPGDEPVKICLHGGRIVEFRKHIPATLTYNQVGESVGFFKFDPATALELACRTAAHVADERREEPHEEVLRELALDHPDLHCEDVTGLPWIEIDFPEDVTRARDCILPRIESA